MIGAESFVGELKINLARAKTFYSDLFFGHLSLTWLGGFVSDPTFLVEAAATFLNFFLIEKTLAQLELIFISASQFYFLHATSIFSFYLFDTINTDEIKL